MESGTIPDVKVQASSTRTGYDAWRGRLNANSCWMPAKNQNTEYIMVTFVTKVTIVAIATQGAPMDGCWVKSYFIKWGDQNKTKTEPKVKRSLLVIPDPVFFLS